MLFPATHFHKLHQKYHGSSFFALEKKAPDSRCLFQVAISPGLFLGLQHFVQGDLFILIERTFE